MSNWTKEDLLLAKRRINNEDTATEEKESLLQRKSEKFLIEIGVPYIHLRNAKKNKSGVADLNFPGPDGIFTAIELKNKSGKLQQDQLIYLRSIIASNSRAFVCRSLDEVIDTYYNGHNMSKEEMIRRLVV